MYRFRSIDCILDKYHELENQEIYFASSEELNDPMEGYRDIVWKGDEIVWTNLLKNYLISLKEAIMASIFYGSNKQLTINDVIVLFNEEYFETESYKQLSNEINEQFFSKQSIQKLVHFLGNKKEEIRRNELVSYLKSINLMALKIIYSVFSSHGIIAEVDTFDEYESEFHMEKLCKYIDTYESESGEGNIDHIEVISQLAGSISDQLELISLYNVDANLNPNIHSSVFLLSKFPKMYIEKLEDFTYPNWYTSCFMSSCSNSSVWGHYGDNHKGVCLDFKIKEKDGSNFMKFNHTKDHSSKSEEIRSVEYKFEKINYENKFVKIDFFRSLGKFTVNQLDLQWYKNEAGEFSKCRDDVINSSTDQLRINYWDNFTKSITTKTNDWEYENEYRIIISDFLYDYSDVSKRKLRYDFNDLDGIIFGIKTSDADKIKIIKIIEKKCREIKRNNFNFYQAKYNEKTGVIEPQRLNLIKFNNI